MLKAIINQILANNFEDLHGSTLHLKIPLSIDVINELLLGASESNKQIKDLHVTKINTDEISLDVTLVPMKLLGNNFELIDRELLIKFHPEIESPNFLLKIEVLDGIKRWENELLEIMFNTMLKNDPVDFEERIFYIKHRELSQNKIFHDLIERITSARIITEEDKLIYDLHFNFR